MEKTKWDYTIENAEKTEKRWWDCRRNLLDMGYGITEANEQANIVVLRETGHRIRKWVDLRLGVK